METKKPTGSDGAGDFSDLLQSVRRYHSSIDFCDLAWREGQLRALNAMLTENENVFLIALNKDLGKSRTEGYVTELGFVKCEISDALKHFRCWAKPKKVSTPIYLQPASSKIMPEPYGTVLIIGTWNYPLHLLLSPLVGCIAAGNVAILKPSEHAPATAELIAELLPRYLDKQAFPVVQGGVQETTALLKERFDKIFFTGSKSIAEIVMKAAAAHVTPVTLELGGKSPCIVDSSANLDIAAKRIMFGKFVNAGQSCVAPDYVLAHENIVEPLTKAFKEVITRFYGENPQASRDYARIVNQNHHQRLVKLMDGQEIAHGGRHDEDDLYIEPTILSNVDPKSDIMAEEIFGPILPILPVKNMAEAFNFVSVGEKPLAAYIFSDDQGIVGQAEQISAGAVSINDTMVHLGVSELPFGGVGASGFGKCHGEWGFKEFSNAKAVYKASSKIDPPLRYPPYGRIKQFILKCLLR